MANAAHTTIAPTQAPAQPAAVIPFPRDYRDAIRAGRKSLPSHDLTNVPVRRFVASVCQAEVNHAQNDFWQVVDGINARGCSTARRAPMPASASRMRPGQGRRWCG
jgi:hypothetical protein